MTGHNRPARLNRSLLAVIGVLLIAAGGFAVATQSGLLTVVDRDAPLVPGTALPPTWALYATAAGAVIAGLLAFRWLLAQLVRAPKPRTWRLETEPARGRTELAAGTAVAPFTAELTSYPGVHTAHATLAGTPTAPVLALKVSVEQDADLSAIRAQLDNEGLPRIRQALDLEALPTTIEFRFTTAAGPRIR